MVFDKKEKSCIRSAPEPILTILVTSTKWSKTASPVVLQLSLALSTALRKFRPSE